MNDIALSGRSLVYSYDQSPALKGVTVQIERGEVVSITGRSGSGKSTLLLCLAGVLRPDAGEVTLGDRVISGESEAARSRLRRTSIGVVFQFGQLVPELTAIENVALPLLLEGVRRKPAIAAARNWLERFEIGAVADARPGAMSGGQAQRVAIARAMVTEPAVLLADEPTGALDTLVGEVVMTQLVRVAREARTTVVLVTHDAMVSAYGDRELHLRDGELAQSAALVSLPTGSAS